MKHDPVLADLDRHLRDEAATEAEEMEREERINEIAERIVDGSYRTRGGLRFGISGYCNVGNVIEDQSSDWFRDLDFRLAEVMQAAKQDDAKLLEAAQGLFELLDAAVRKEAERLEGME